jgi:lipopolysaccharide exporter
VAVPDEGHSRHGEAPPEAVGRQAVRGIPWSLGGYAVSRAMNLLTTVVLARLLTPEDFGLIAVALLALTVLNVLSDGGLTSVLVVRQDFGRRALGTVLTLLLVAGGVVSLLLVALAPLIAELFREPDLTAIVRAIAGISLLSGFYWFYDMLLQRELEFRKRFVAQLARTVAYGAVALTMAVLGAGVWSLVGGQLAGAVVVSVVLFVLAPYRVRPAFDRGEAATALRAGHGFLLQIASSTVQDNLDYLVIGRVLGAGPLGAYSMAYRLSEVPYASIADPIARVTFAAMARMKHAGQAVGPMFLRSLGFTCMLTWPLGVLLSAAADPFTRAVLGDQWLVMIGPLSVLGLWAAARATETTVGWFLNAAGEAGRNGRIATYLLAPLALAVFIAAETGGTVAVAWVLVAQLVVTLLAQAAVAHRRLDVSSGSQWKAIRGLVVPAAACWAATRLVIEAADGLGPAAVLALGVAAGLAVYVALVAVLSPALVRRALEEGRRMRRRGLAEQTEPAG